MSLHLSLDDIARRLRQDAGMSAMRRSGQAAKGGGALTNSAVVGNAIERGDHDLNPHLDVNASVLPPADRLKHAAVLVPIVQRPAGLTVLLTKRTTHLRDHAGQISFPGGRVEKHDVDAVAAAVRETEEETGVPADRIEILGRLDPYRTRTGFLVEPVVGAVYSPFELKPDPFEVEEVFEVPLAFFLDRTNHKKHSRMHEGVRRRFYAMPYGDYYIWGATAGMLVNLVDVLQIDLTLRGSGVS